MTEKGWDVAVTDDGGMAYEGNLDQEDQFAADIEACFDEIGYDPQPRRLSQEEAEAVYENLLDVAECMRGLGYQCPFTGGVELRLHRPRPACLT